MLKPQPSLRLIISIQWPLIWTTWIHSKFRCMPYTPSLVYQENIHYSYGSQRVTHGRHRFSYHSHTHHSEIEETSHTHMDVKHWSHKSNIARFVVITHLDCNNWVTTRAHVKETTFSQMPMTAIIQFNAKVTANTHQCKTTAISQIDNQHSMTTYMDHLDSLKVQVYAIHTITCISRKHPLLIWILKESLMVAIGLVTTELDIKAKAITQMVVALFLFI